jgi:DNA-binding protein YbaB
MEMLDVRISQDLMAEGDAPMLGDLVAAAYNNAQEKIKESLQTEMGSMAANLGLVGVPGWPGTQA